MIIRITFSVILILISLYAYAFEISGIAYVTDGDTIKIDNNKIRLKGIDAPELNQTCEYLLAPWQCGEAAKNGLINKIRNKNVNCKISKKDRYNRFLGTCYTNEENINAWLVEQGLAVIYFTKEYESEQFRAREFKRGIWGSKFVMPSEFRKM